MPISDNGAEDSETQITTENCLMGQEHAELIAAKALGWLASNSDLMPVFLGSTGLNASNLRSQADDPAFLLSVLDFLTMNDAWVIAFCDAENIPYEAPMQARQALPGGTEVHWT